MKRQTEPTTFGEFFKNKRITLGFTLRSFCERYDFDPAYISRIERGILAPTLNQNKLEVYAEALKISKNSTDRIKFFDLAHLAKGMIPEDIKKSPQMMTFMPAFYRSIRGEKMNQKKLDQLLELLCKDKKNNE